MTRWKVAHLDEVARTGRHDEWIPLRAHLRVRAFGVNAWLGHERGDPIANEHDELATGHEELYVVVRGRATFTIAGDEIDAPAGTIIFVRDPAARRGAVAAETGTTIFTAGAKPGEPFRVSAWELWTDVEPLYSAKDYEGAMRVLEEGLERYPENAGLLYNLACCESLLGRRDAALEHLEQAVAGRDEFREIARDDEDFAALREHPRFASLVAGQTSSDGASA